MGTPAEWKKIEFSVLVSKITVLTRSNQLFLTVKMYIFNKTSYLNKDVNCIWICIIGDTIGVTATFKG